MEFQPGQKVEVLFGVPSPKHSPPVKPGTESWRAGAVLSSKDDRFVVRVARVMGSSTLTVSPRMMRPRQ